MEIRENVSLVGYNTFGIDVKAKLFAEATSVQDFIDLLVQDEFHYQDRLILGGGSNILFTKDVEGIVIKNSLKGIELLKEDDDHYYIRSAAGEVWHDLVMHCVQNKYAGLENLSLIPGNVGASPMQNIGAYGVEMKDYFHSLEALHTDTLQLETFNYDDCEFGYRDSVFKNRYKGEFIILSVTFRLNKRPIFATQYGAIEEELKRQGVNSLSIEAISKAVIAIRQSKLPDPKQIGNAGSFFKNPLVSNVHLQQLQKTFPEIVSYPVDSQFSKLAAGWLIEKAGWKGKRIDDYGVHDKQALVLVNYGNAKGQAILNLSNDIINDVNRQFGVALEREVNIY